MTALFEFTSPENRVVIAYDRPTLTLLAGRDNRTGRYCSHQELQALPISYDVPLIHAVQHAGSTHGLRNERRSRRRH